MRVEKKTKAFAYRVPIGDYNYLQCAFHKNRKIRFTKLVSILPTELIYLYHPNKSFSDIPADGVKMRLPKQSD